jgi:hypothetical protein
MPMDQSASKSTSSSSPAVRSPNASSTAADTPISKAPTSPATRKLPASSPVEPFPELDLDLEAEFEEDRSPTFAHEADTHTAPAALNLPAPAVARKQSRATGPVLRASVSWTQGNVTSEEDREMKEATDRALGNARKMFGEEFGCKNGDGGASEDNDGTAK